MRREPTPRSEITGVVATPPTSATGSPSKSPSKRNCTVPVGVPAPGITDATVAVNVTGVPATDGLADDVSVVVVAFSTTCVSSAPLPTKLASPSWTTVTRCEPRLSDEVPADVALPSTRSTGPPRSLPSTR